MLWSEARKFVPEIGACLRTHGEFASLISMFSRRAKAQVDLDLVGNLNRILVRGRNT